VDGGAPLAACDGGPRKIFRGQFAAGARRGQARFRNQTFARTCESLMFIWEEGFAGLAQGFRALAPDLLAGIISREEAIGQEGINQPPSLFFQAGAFPGAP
jgi:hypothetical protein